MATTITDLNDLFKQRYMEDITVADTAIARKLYPNAEKLENGELKIGEKFTIPESGPIVSTGRRSGKSLAAQYQVMNQMIQYGLIGPNKPSEASEDSDE